MKKSRFSKNRNEWKKPAGLRVLPDTAAALVRFVRDIVLVVFLGVVTYRIALTVVTIDMSNFDFSDLLAMILALFAIGLSAAFYFKANETSNRFYDKVLEFTKDTSELLGRMESGFGERLKHMDAGYAGLSEKFDRLPIDRAKAEKEVAEEEAEAEKTAKEREEFIKDFLDQAKVQAVEKGQFLEKLKEKDSELERVREEARRLQHRLDCRPTEDPTITNHLRKYIENNIVPRLRRLEITHSCGLSDIGRVYDGMKDEMLDEFVSDMIRNGYVDKDDGGLTVRGARLILSVMTN